MKSANAPFNEFGQSMILRDIEDLYIDIDQINSGANGLQSQVTTLVKTVSGLSSSVAAIAVFNASGASHSTGLVPDPGASAGSTRYLREDATWATVATSVLYAMYSGTSAANTATPLNDVTLTAVFATTIIDQFSGAWASGVFTAPATGLYSLCASVYGTSGGATATTGFTLQWIYSTGPGSFETAVTFGTATSAIATIHALIYMTNGSTATLKATSKLGAGNIDLGFTSNRLTIARLA